MKPNENKKNYPWIMWALAACFYAYRYVLDVFPSVATHELMQSFKVNATMLGNLTACYFYA
jgi:hypothetical protein